MFRHTATSPVAGQPLSRVHFGGPDRPPRALRDLLEERIHAVPRGGRIDWVTYYFRDSALARALVFAQRRGVRVRVAVDGRPRLAGANDNVRRLLAGAEGIGDGFKAVCPPRPLPGFGPERRMHAKIYCFSHPKPCALVGSFNPSGDEPEDMRVISQIGDQNRGHNALVEITHPALVSELTRHTYRMFSRADRPLWRWRAVANRVVNNAGTRLYFYPRVNHRLMFGLINDLGADDRLRIATSHMKAGSVLRGLSASSRRGADISVITHDTERRAPDDALRAMRSDGVEVRRYRHDSGLPMHNKFLLLERGGRRHVYFGSLNLNLQSQVFNHEILVRSEDSGLFDAFAERWDQIYAETPDD